MEITYPPWAVVYQHLHSSDRLIQASSQFFERDEGKRRLFQGCFSWLLVSETALAYLIWLSPLVVDDTVVRWHSSSLQILDSH